MPNSRPFLHCSLKKIHRNLKFAHLHKVKVAPKGQKSTDHKQNLISSEGGQGTSVCQISGHSSFVFSRKYQDTLNLTSFTKTKLRQLIQITASAPSHPIQHPTTGEITPMTPVGLGIASCRQITSILSNIGRRNSIRIFFWNILMWAQFICFIKIFAF